MAIINDNGVSLRTISEIVADNTTIWTEKTGEADVAPSSAAGELIAISSEIEARMDQDISDAVKQNTIEATGDFLTSLAFLKNQDRKTQEPSVVYLKFVSSGSDFTITSGTNLICSDNNEVFTLDYDINIVYATSDTAYGSATSENIGISASANSVTLEIPIAGLTVANNRASYDGFEDESDEDLRKRLSTIGTPFTQNTKVGLQQKLISLTGVKKVNVFDNKTLSPVEGVPAKNFETTILGGNFAEIGKSIHVFTGCGNPSYGDIVQLVKADDGNIYPVKFSIPEEIEVTINATLTTNGEFNSETGKEEVRKILVNYVDDLNIGDDLFFQKMESLCLIDGVTNVVLTLNGGSVSLFANHKELFITNSSLVTVTN